MSEEGQQQETSWRDGIADEALRSSPALADVTSMESLAKQFVDQQKFIGNSIRVPSDEAGDGDRQAFTDKLLKHAPNLMHRPNFDDPEQSKEFYRAIGLPEDHSGYAAPEIEGLQLPEERVNFLRETAYKHNLPAKQFEGMMTDILTADAVHAAQQKETLTASQTALGQEWGMAHEGRVNAVHNMLRQMEAPEALQKAFTDGNVDGPTIKWLHTVAKQLGGSGHELTKQQGSQENMTPDEAKSRIGEIYANPKHPFMDRGHPAHQEWVRKKMLDLRKYL